MTTKADNAVKKTSSAIHNAKLVFKDNSKIMILILALHIMAVPLVLITTAYNITSGRGSQPNESFLILGIITTGAAGLLGVSVAINNFSYLFKKTDVDMVYSLPISKRHKFLSDYISGLISYVAPFVAVQAISSIMLVIFHFAFDGKTFNYAHTDEYGNPVTFICDIFGLIMPDYFKLVLIGIIIMIMLYTVTVLIITCCGSAFECIFYNVLLNAALPITIVLFSEFLFIDLFGVIAAYKFQWVLYATSPVGGAIGGILRIFSDLPITSVAISTIVFTAIYFVSAYFLYMKRKAEDVGKPFVFKVIYYITMTLVVFCIGLYYMHNEMSVVTAIIVTCLLYIIMEMVTNRGLKKIWMSFLRYGLTIGLVYGFIFVFNATEGLGSIQKVPSLNSIKEVGIYYSDNKFLDIDSSSYYDFHSILGSSVDQVKNDGRFINYTSKDKIEQILNMHENIIDEYNIFGEFSDEFSYSNTPVSNKNGEYLVRDYADVCIVYYLKNGQTIMRNYTYLSLDNIEYLERLNFSEEFNEKLAKYVPFSMNMCKSIRKASDNNSTEASFFVFSKWYRERIADKQYSYTSFDDSFYDEFGEAYLKDYSEDSYDKRYGSNLDVVYISFLSRYVYIIPEYYTNTREVLNKYNVEIPYVTKEKLDNYVKENINGTILEIISYEDMRDLSHRTTLISSLTPYNFTYNIWSDYRYNNVYEVTEDLFTLMEVARVGYITDENCYTIKVGGTIGIIPPEYNDVAKRVYDQAGYYKYADKMGIAYETTN